MLNPIRKWIITRSPSTIRWIVFLFSFGIVVSRIVNQSARERIDILNVVLLSVALLAILREDIKNLISKMKGVGFPGLQIPIEQLEEDTRQVENRYKELIRKHVDKTEFRNNNISKPQDIVQTYLETEFKIEEELEKIAIEYKSQSKNQDDVPIHANELTDYLIEHEVIGEDVYQLVKRYWKLKDNTDSPKEIKELTLIAIRILRILRSILESIQDLKIGKSKNNQIFKGNPYGMQLGGMLFEQIDEEIVALYTTVNLLDSDVNAFPLIQLDESNFEIKEKKKDGRLKKAELVKVVPIGNNIDLTIILAIDTSLSMNDDNKLFYAKEAAISLVQRLLLLANETNLNIAIYPFNSENKNGFIDFGDKRVWSNNFDEIRSAISNLIAKGNTPLYDCLKFSINHLQQFKGYKAIICLSDGEENYSSETEYQEIFELGSNARIPVYSVGYGVDEHLEFLVEFSSLTNAGEEGIGSFMRVHPESLPNIFGYLAGAVTNIYGIYWKPNDKSKKSPTTYKIIVKYKTKSFGEINVEFKEFEYKLK